MPIIPFTKKVIRYSLGLYDKLGRSISYYKNFGLLNTKVILEKRLTIKSTRPEVYQAMYLTGAGKFKIGKNCFFGYKPGGFHRKGTIEFQARSINSIIEIGDNVNTNNNIFICCFNSITIGDDTLIGQNVTIMDFEAHGIEPELRKSIGEIGSVKIGKNVWIGNNVTILKNSTIGDNTIIATGAVVTGQFGDNLIIGGVPAQIIKTII